MEEEQELANYIFEKINAASSIEELKEIENDNSLAKYKMNIKDYPEIKFSITPKEITSIKNGRFDENDNFIIDNLNITDPLTKLLYAIAWKNGDLKKLKHIINGIHSTEDIKTQKEALTFFQFGKYLKKQGEPIIDQHVIRAFVFYKSQDEEMREYKTIDSLNKKHIDQITEYKKWLKELGEKPNFPENYAYYVDKILFATGKAIKNM